MLRALDFTSNVVSMKVLEKILKEVEITGDKDVDYKGTVFHDNVYETLAKHYLYYDIRPFNIERSIDEDLIEFNILKLQQPKAKSIAEFKHIFKKRFPEGTVCVLDKTSLKMVKERQKNRKVILIEEILENYVRVREYYSSKMQPRYFRKKGPDNPELFIRSEVSFVDLYKQEIVIEYPKNGREVEVIDILFYGG